MKQLHDIQLGILYELVIHQSLPYTKLKPDVEMENNQFDWHLKALLKNNLVEKIGDEYSLSTEGKAYANGIDADTKKFEIQAKLAVWMVCVRTTTSGQKEFLMYLRKKHPFYDCQGFPGGKIKLGETVHDAATRELKEETDLTGTPELIHIWHYVLKDDVGTLLEDKYMFLCRFTDPVGKLIPSNEEGEYYWVAEDKIDEWAKNPFETIEQIKEIVSIVNKCTTSVSLKEESFQNNKF